MGKYGRGVSFQGKEQQGLEGGCLLFIFEVLQGVV